MSQSIAQQQTNLDSNIKNTKIVIDIPPHTTQISRTPIKCSISTNNNNISLTTSTHLQSPTTEISHMWDNNIGSTTNKYQKIDQTLDN